MVWVCVYQTICITFGDRVIKREQLYVLMVWLYVHQTIYIKFGDQEGKLGTL